jgi:hypothetical protein
MPNVRIHLVHSLRGRLFAASTHHRAKFIIPKSPPRLTRKIALEIESAQLAALQLHIQSVGDAIFAAQFSTGLVRPAIRKVIPPSRLNCRTPSVSHSGETQQSPCKNNVYVRCVCRARRQQG